MNKSVTYVVLALLIASALPLSAQADQSQDIPTNASGTGVHNSLVAALAHANLVGTLSGPGPFTVFAPTDQAFTDAGINLNDYDTPEENATLTDILLHHVISGSVPAADVKDGMMATMVNGDKVKFTVSNGAVSIGAALVTTPDVLASNGIIHVIDKVLMPPANIPATAQSTGIHNSLVAAVIQADLLSTLEGPGPFTVFAPTDQAFTDAGIDLASLDTPEGKATLSDILLYHVVAADVPAKNVTDCMLAGAANGQQLSFTVGDSVMVNDANVTLTDVISSNGLIHVIDKVLMPTDSPRDIPRTAQCTGIHDSLVAGVVQAELLETLQGPGPFTIFAPTDQAFIDAGIDLAALDTPEGKATLSNILLYHVVSGEVPAANVSECMSANAVNGQPISFTVSGGVMVNDANVTLADVTTSNGIIHVIDKVLTPSDSPNDIPRTAQCTGIHDSLVAAVIQADLLPTLQGPGPFTVFAPTDQAFIDAGIDLASLDTPEGKAALSNILLYHVVSGNVPSSAVTECMSADAVNGQSLSFTVNGGVMVNDANVTLADVATSNGVIHVIDKVLMPTATPNDIPRTAQCTGIHNTLVTAVIQGGLLETLQGEGPFTVFAPTDQAFTDAGIDLSAVSQSDLADILTYHVVSGAVPASAVTECMSADSVNGNPLSFTVDGGVMVNGANVTLADVNTSNGVIHVIDKVLMPTATPNDIPRTAQCTGIHDTLVTAVIQGGLLETLQGEGPFTVFAPTDQAFTDAGIDLSAVSQSDLADILTYHVVSGAVPYSAVTECMSADSVNGNPLSFTVRYTETLNSESATITVEKTVMVNGANVTVANVNTSNGVIHVIDKVLMPTATPNDIPRTAQCTGIHDTLVTAVIQGGLLETLQGEGPFTVFAPTDQAFADAGIDLAALDTPEGKAALSDILLYHVVSGEVPSTALSDCMTTTAVNGQTLAFTIGDSVMVNDATVTLPDVATSNGIIHVIDTVLTPSDAPSDITETAQCTGTHASLVAALIQAELVETLQGEGPFTVFAPTDQAFADAGIDLAALDSPEGKTQLSDILLYHVYAGTVLSTDITEGMTLQMVNGKNATFTLSPSIDGANITGADVVTSNGIIHVIDAVIIPQAEVDPTTTGDGVESEEEDSNIVLIASIIGIVLIVLIIGGLLYSRGREESSPTEEKDFSSNGLAATPQPASTYSYEPQQSTYTSQYAPQQSQPLQPVQVQPVQTQVAQPVAQVQATQPIVEAQQTQAITQTQASQTAIQLPEVLQQWTDDSGYTWRRMSDGSTMWWNGTDWQPYS